MIEEEAVVTATGEGVAWVETRRRSACGSCAVAHGCGTRALSGVFGRRSAPMRVLDGIGTAVGERVIVGIDEGALVRGSAAVYMVPLLALLAGAGAGQAMAGSDAAAIAGAAAGVGLALGWLRRFGRRVRGERRYQPVILRRCRADGLPVTVELQS